MLPPNDARCEHCGAMLSRSNRPLTRQQAALYGYLGRYIAANGFAPSFEEIATAFGYHSLATVHEHLTNIERKGWIRRRYNESRSIELVSAA